MAISTPISLGSASEVGGGASIDLVTSQEVPAGSKIWLEIGGQGQRPGEAVSIFATGLGSVTPAIAAGAPAPRDPLSYTVETPVVSITRSLSRRRP